MSRKDDNSNDRDGKDPSATAPRKALSRRALLKGSVATMPAILTLHSGAALARSSNLISGTPSYSRDSQGRTLCLDTDSVYPASRRGDIYDLGDPPYARVSAINDRDYWTRPSYHHSDRISESRMCESGGTYYYRSRWGWGGWRETKVPRGILVSATALTSFASDIVITDL